MLEGGLCKVVGLVKLWHISDESYDVGRQLEFTGWHGMSLTPRTFLSGETSKYILETTSEAFEALNSLNLP